MEDKIAFVKKKIIKKDGKLIKKLKNIYYKYIKRINIVKKNNCTIYEYYNDKNYNKLIRKLKYHNITKVILADNLKDMFLKTRILFNNIEVIDGKEILSKLSYNVFLKFCDLKRIDPYKEKIYIMVKEYNEINIFNIKQIIKSASVTHIISTNIGKYSMFANEVEEKDGILISVSNNKTKGLKKAKTIINIDLNENEVNEFNIPNDAIIINLKHNVKIRKKAFLGCNINNVIISYKKIDYELLKEFNSMKLAEYNLLNETLEIKDIKINQFVDSRNNVIQSFNYGKEYI